MEISKRAAVETPINIDGKWRIPRIELYHPYCGRYRLSSPNERNIVGEVARLLHHPRRWLALTVVFLAVTSNVRFANIKCGAAQWWESEGIRSKVLSDVKIFDV